MTFDAIGIAGSALTVHRKWLDAVSDNLANINDVSRTSGKAFQARYVEAAEGSDGNGVYVKSTPRAVPPAGWCTNRTIPLPTPRGTCVTRTSTSPNKWVR